MTFFSKEFTKNFGRRKFKGVSRYFQGGSRKFQWPFKQVLRRFQESVKDVLRVFLGSLNGSSRVFQGSFKKMFKVFQISLMLHVTHRSYPSRRRACFLQRTEIHAQILNNQFCTILGSLDICKQNGTFVIG